MLLGRSTLLGSIVDDKIQEKVVTSENAANLSSALQIDEQFLVHKLFFYQSDIYCSDSK